jgi:hypothetical protein
MNGTVARPAEHGEVRCVAVVRDAPGHDVMDVDSHAIGRSTSAPTACALLGLQRSAPMGLPFRAVEHICCGPDTLRDTGAGSAALDVALDRGTAVGAVTLGALGGAPTRHAERLIFREHDLPASPAGRLRGSDALAAQLVRAVPAPAGLTIAGRCTTCLAVSRRPSSLRGGACRATGSASLDRRTAVRTALRRVRLMRDLARFAARGVPRDLGRTVGADSCRHRTNMIPDWRCR